MEILFIVFFFIIAGFLIIDLGYLNRKAHVILTKEAAIQSLFWIGISLFYFSLIWIFASNELASQFLGAYITEKMLSVDNLFVMMLIFQYFKLETKYYHRTLYWGILGAVIFRTIFITAGITILSFFHWVLYIFGAVLVYTGWKLLIRKDKEDDEFKENRLFLFLKKYFPFTTDPHEGKFVLRKNGKLLFTSLFSVLLLIETTDILFAFDSIPAVFAISQNWFIVFTSNIFAVMGLRALFFLVENILRKFRYIQYGISLILIFIGTKMLADIVEIRISSTISLMVIVGLLGTSFLFSILFSTKAVKTLK